MTRREFFIWTARGMIALALADAFVVEPGWIEWTDFSFVPRKDAATPVKFVQISDLHLKILDGPLTDAAVKINKMKPDLLLLTGDSVDRQQDLPVLDDFLDLIDRSIPKVAILGNWEYWGKIDLGALESIYQRHNCRLLVNDCALYSFSGRRVLITGVDDFVAGDADIKKALRGFQENHFHIVLNHCPEYRDFMIKELSSFPAVDAVLSGHTHGGQVNVLGFIPVLPPGSGHYVKGWYGVHHPPMYVSRGIGTSVFPVRFGSRPEIITFHVNV